MGEGRNAGRGPGSLHRGESFCSVQEARAGAVPGSPGGPALSEGGPRSLLCPSVPPRARGLSVAGLGGVVTVPVCLACHSGPGPGRLRGGDQTQQVSSSVAPCDRIIRFLLPACGRGQRRGSRGSGARGVGPRVSQPCRPQGSVEPPPLEGFRPPPLRFLGAYCSQVPRRGACGHDGAFHLKVKCVGVLVQDRSREGEIPFRARWTVALPLASDLTASSTVPPVCVVQRTRGCAMPVRWLGLGGRQGTALLVISCPGSPALCPCAGQSFKGPLALACVVSAGPGGEGIIHLGSLLLVLAAGLPAAVCPGRSHVPLPCGQGHGLWHSSPSSPSAGGCWSGTVATI